MSNGHSHYKWGAILSYASTLLGIVLGLVMAPLMAKYLGRDQYGFYEWLGVFVSYITLMDFGLGNAVIRHVARYRSEGKLREMEGFLGMVIRLYAAIGGVILLLGAVGYTFLPRILPTDVVSSPQLSAMAQPMFALFILNMMISMLCNIFPAVLNGHEQFATIRVIGLGRQIVRAVVLVIMLRGGCTALDIVLLDTLINLASAVLQILLVRFRLGVRIHFDRFDPELVRTVFRYSIFIFLNMVMDFVYWQVDTTIIGFISVSMVVVTRTGGRFPGYMLEFSNAISGLMLPKATRMVAGGAGMEELTNLMIRIGRIQLIVVCLLVVGFGFVGQEFLMLWMGETLGVSGVAQAYAIALMQMLALVVPLSQCTAICIVQALDRHAFRSVVLALISVLNIAISIVLALKWGPVGAAVGTVVSLLIGNVGIINWYYHFRIGLNIPRFFRETFHGTLPALLLICAACCLTFLMPSGTYLTLLLRVAVIAALYGLIMYAAGMNPSERKLVASGIHRVLGRR